MEPVPALKSWRESHDPPLSQQQAAAVFGVARETWARWESGKRRIDGDKLQAVAEHTGIPRTVLRPDLARLLGESATEAAE